MLWTEATIEATSLPKQAMEILERIDNFQFAFVPGRGTTDAIFVVLQLQESSWTERKHLSLSL